MHALTEYKLLRFLSHNYMHVVSGVACVWVDIGFELVKACNTFCRYEVECQLTSSL